MPRLHFFSSLQKKAASKARDNSSTKSGIVVAPLYFGSSLDRKTHLRISNTPPTHLFAECLLLEAAVFPYSEAKDYAIAHKSVTNLLCACRINGSSHALPVGTDPTVIK